MKQRAAGKTHIRQEVLNVLIAQLLQERGIVAVPESIIPDVSGRSRDMPDVLVDFEGLRLAIEGEFAAPRAMAKARSSALSRVTEGIAHVGVALIYPADLKSLPTDISILRNRLAKAELRFAIVTEVEADQLMLPYEEATAGEPVPFDVGTVESLAAAMRRCYEYLVKDTVLQRAAEMLDSGIEIFVRSLSRQPATTDRFMTALGISALPPVRRKGAKEEDAGEEG